MAAQQEHLDLPMHCQLPSTRGHYPRGALGGHWEEALSKGHPKDI